MYDSSIGLWLAKNDTTFPIRLNFVKYQSIFNVF